MVVRQPFPDAEMDHLVQVWEGDYGDREPFLNAVSKINDEDLNALTGLVIYWSDIPYSLSLFVSLTLDPAKEGIDDVRERIQNTLLSAGAIRRSDITLRALIDAQINRRLNIMTIAKDKPVHDPCGFMSRKQCIERGYGLDEFKPQSRVFLSHQSERKPEVAKLQELLANKEVPTWMDAHDIELGENLAVAINRGIGESTAVIFWISPKFLESRWCEYEFENFNSIYAGNNSIKVISIVEESCAERIPRFLSQLNYIKYTSNDDVVGIANRIAPILKRTVAGSPGIRRPGGFG